MRLALAVFVLGGCHLAFRAEADGDAPTAPVTFTLTPGLASPVFADGDAVSLSVDVQRSEGDRRVYYRLECGSGVFAETNRAMIEGETQVARVEHVWRPPTTIGVVTCGIIASFDPLLADPVTDQVKTTVITHVGAFDLSPATPQSPANNIIAVGFIPTMSGMLTELGAHVTSAGNVRLALYSQRLGSPALFDILAQTEAVPAPGAVLEPITPVTVTAQVLHYIVIQGEQAMTFPGLSTGNSPPCQTLANQFPDFAGTITFTATVNRRFEVFGTLWPLE